MAIGFTPKHIERYPLHTFNKEQFLILFHKAARTLDWSVPYMSTSGIIAFTGRSMFTWNAEIKITFEDNTAIIQSSSTGSEFMDGGKNKKKVHEFISTLNAAITSSTAEELDANYLLLQDKFTAPEDDILLLPPPTTGQQIKDFFSIFVPKKELFITPLLLDINIVIFILMIINGAHILSPSSESLLAWGANFRPATLEGEWWRLITACFVHIGIIHIAMNMFALLYIGTLLEPLIGKSRFVAAYLLTGITASITSLWWHDNVVSAGASGAIFGMYGIFLALLTSNLIAKEERKSLLNSIGFFVAYNLIFGLQGGIDNAAHIGGLLGGLIIGFAYIPGLIRTNETSLKYPTIGIVTLLICAGSFFIYQNIPNDFGIYTKKMEQVSFLEGQALQLNSKTESLTSTEDILKEINTTGITNWNQSIEIMNSLDSLDLPLEFRTRNRLIKEYLELRLEQCKLLYKTVYENSTGYKLQLDECERKIKEKLDAISKQ